MTYLAKLIYIDELIEDEVHVDVAGKILVCFSVQCPYSIEVGGDYLVEIFPYIYNDYSVREIADTEESGLLRLGDSFSYVARGRLNGNRLTVHDLVLEDDVLLQTYKRFDGKLIELKIDRLDLAFK